MQWADVRRHFPHQWVLVEAILAHTEGKKRIVEELSVVNTYSDGQAAWKGYSALHRELPRREFFPVHTDREELDIIDSRWSSVSLNIRDGS